MKTEFSETTLRKAKEEVVRVQVERFHLFYSHYFRLNETIAMATFFFERIYNLNAKEEWLSIAFDTFSKVKGMIKETTRTNIENLIELNTITDELDTKLANLLLEKGWEPGDQVSQSEYKKYFIELDHRTQRVKQLKVVLFNLQKFYDLAHKPMSGYIIKPAGFMAKMLGVYPLFQSVEEGYFAILPVTPQLFASFVEEVTLKEWEFLFDCFPDLRSTEAIA